ncbi:hypothetical protein AUJ95_02755 [Candidatus Desantisbacteria bacterium CG2_30_40_21]|uniref:Fibronectin type-III domain-containing protein n=1 Tax=Candidatus Desantisbacteria bacterium CG2_30_40_21 TaxID=1817895 RepID=A0A1J5E2C1_9BACT|nr:MAG: hypothetical protein AUJ95_02755 [Candidatus Desantisbacteria bacterium CG2_30_40_21]
MFSIRIMFLLAGLFLITPAFASQPKEIKQTNITGEAFTISWITDTPGTAAIQYGIGTNSLNFSATDNRLASTHHILIKGLSPNTTYYYDIVSAGVTDNNQGQHYSIKTGSSITRTGSDFVYGQVDKADLTMASGSLVYLQICNTNGTGSIGSSSEWSTVVDQNGTWGIDLINVRTKDLLSFFGYSQSGDSLSIFVQGGIDGTGKLLTNTAYDSPCQSIRISTDTTAPAAITTLSSKTIRQTSVVLEWSSPGNDGNTGIANRYEVRYSTNAITESNWLQASIVSTGVPTPKPANTNQQCTVSNLMAKTGYYFAIKACDEVPNWSGLSNLVAATTLVPSTATLEWIGKPNFASDGLRTEISTSGMNIVYQVSYSDVDGKPPALGYPKVGIYQEETIVGTYTMLYAYGNYSTGAVYTFSRQLEPGTYTYQFDGGNNVDKDNSNAHLHVKNGPIILEAFPEYQAATNLGTITTGSDLIYGHVYRQRGTQFVSDALVYVRIQDNDNTQTSGYSTIGSTTVGTDGIWYMELANFKDGYGSLAKQFTYSTSTDYLHIWVNGAADGVASQILMTNEGKPVCDLELCNDHIPPTTITDLAVKTSTTTTITLNWTTSGDDGNIGKASYYHIRYATSSDKVVDWGMSAPLVTGTSSTITNLTSATTYYFTIQASDDVWNTSAPSLIVMGTTAPPLQRPPTLSSANKPLTPGTANVYTKFTYNVKYSDADGDPPSSGEPKVIIYQGDKVVKTSTMSFAAGSYISGATYTYSTLLPEGTYSYRFEVTGATSSPTGIGPMVFDISKHIRITNVTDKEFTVSWKTLKGTGSVSYGTTTALGSTTTDNMPRDVHFVTVGNLEPDTVYYFNVACSGRTDDNQGRQYLIKTGAFISDISPGSNLVTGRVYERKGVPAEGAVVFVTIKDANGKDSLEECAPLSTLTEADGRWYMDMRYARTRDYLSKFEYSSDDTIRIEADGGERGEGNSGDVGVDKVDMFIAPDIILHTWQGAKDKLLVKDMTYSYPNPAKQVNIITFRYFLNTDADVTLSIYNLAGELVQTIKGMGVKFNDTNELVWDISDVASDIYIWRLEAKTEELRDVVVKRLVVIK